jgi:hypothetical protein
VIRPRDPSSVLAKFQTTKKAYRQFQRREYQQPQDLRVPIDQVSLSKDQTNWTKIPAANIWTSRKNLSLEYWRGGGIHRHSQPLQLISCAKPCK